ncbi:MAG: hypothetical protein PHG00_01010 [Methylococcales bacterium]|nr:hypothetical protein [Methylococcales bacterium]
MIIFLRNIPFEAKKFEIAIFINRVLDECFLDRPNTKVSVGDIETLSIQDIDANKIEKHGLVRVFPNEVGKRVVKKLNGTTFKQTPVSAHEYVSRSVQNDPRNNDCRAQMEFQDRRIADRRRSPLMHSWQKDLILVHSTLS